MVLIVQEPWYCLYYSCGTACTGVAVLPVQELWCCLLISVALVTLLLILLLWAANWRERPESSWFLLDWSELAAFLLRAIFTKEVFLLTHPAGRYGDRSKTKCKT